MADQIRNEHRQLIVPTVRPTIFNCDVRSFDVAALGQPFAECRSEVSTLLWRAGEDIPYQRHRALLRARCERPRGRRAAEQRYEVAPPQVEHAASSPGATAIIRLPSDVLAQSVCRTFQLADGRFSTVFGADLNCSESR